MKKKLQFQCWLTQLLYYCFLWANVNYKFINKPLLGCSCIQFQSVNMSVISRWRYNWIYSGKQAHEILPNNLLVFFSTENWSQVLCHFSEIKFLFPSRIFTTTDYHKQTTKICWNAQPPPFLIYTFFCDLNHRLPTWTVVYYTHFPSGCWVANITNVE